MRLIKVENKAEVLPIGVKVSIEPFGFVGSIDRILILADYSIQYCVTFSDGGVIQERWCYMNQITILKDSDVLKVGFNSGLKS